MSTGDASPAELLPGLYRAVLDRVAHLERCGERAEAARLRAEAIRAYARSWDLDGRRRLEAILRRADRALAASRPPPAAAPPESPLPSEAVEPPAKRVKRRLPTAV